MDKKNIKTILALTPLQQGMLFQHLKDPDSAGYNEQLSLALSGDIRPDVFKQALAEVVQANGALRTRFRWEGLKNPVQVVLKEHTPPFHFHDFSHRAPAAARETLETLKAGDARKGFNLEEVPLRVMLCRLPGGQGQLVVSHHHILYDGWSTGILVEELFSAYACLTGRAPVPARVKTPFREYVRWLQQRDKGEQEAFWRSSLEGFEVPGGLCAAWGKGRTDSAGHASFSSFTLELPVRLTEALFTAAREWKLTPATLFYGAWGLLVQRYTNCPDVLFGTTVSGRSAGVRGIESMVGLFINTVPLRVREVPSGEKAKDFLESIQEQCRRREPHETTPLVEINSYCPGASVDGLFDHILVIENYPLEQALLKHGGGPVSITSYHMEEETHYDLTVGITPLDAGTRVDFSFNTDRFGPPAIRALADHFKALLKALAKCPDLDTGELEFLSAEEKQRLLVSFNRTGVEYPPAGSINAHFAAQAARTPGRTAVVSSRGCITYGELDSRASAMARELRARGAGPGTIVGIKIHRQLEITAGILGILKSGAAYLPLDPGWPEERINYMLADSAAVAVLTEADLTGPADRDRKDKPLPLLNRPGDPAYVIYTSGTTGRPKGVLVNHAAVGNRLNWVWERFGLSEGDVVLQAAPFFFDVSVCEMFRWILPGARLCLLPPGAEKDPGELVSAVARHRVSTADLVPAMLELLLEQAEKNRRVKELASLRWVVTGVEAVGLELVKRFNRLLFSANGTRLINAYGPTESTVDVTWFDCSVIGDDYRGTIPIGKPIANVRAYILDRLHRLQPVGVAGQLCIAGKGLARGYLNNPELTADAFVSTKKGDRQETFPQLGVQGEPPPGLPGGPPEGTRYHAPRRADGDIYSHDMRDIFYLTGDLARWLPDGNIEFLGRMDRQVKIRGHRVELEEIESRLRRHEDVRDAAVAAFLHDRGGYYLCAYVEAADSGNPPGASELQEFLSLTLPTYMIPPYVEGIARIPRTAAGKVDRRALAPPQTNPADDRNTPSTGVEHHLRSIWSTLLEIEEEHIGVEDDFFALGGHSLTATALASLILRNLEVKVPLAEIFKRPTIRRLALYIEGAAHQAFVPIEPAERKEYYPLSPGQRRLYVLQQMEETRTSYNMFHAAILRGEVSLEKLERVFRELIRRHESLRTSFILVGSEPVQRIHPPGDIRFHIGRRDLASEGTTSIEEIISDFISPFDLSQPPLLRARLVSGGNRHYMLLDLHHIIADGASIEGFIEEFARLYGGNSLPPVELPPVELQYKDFSEWRRKDFEAGKLQHLEDYWLNRFSGEIPQLDLPFDYPRPPRQLVRFDRVRFEAGPELTAAVKQMASKNGATMFMVLLSIYCILLSRYGGGEDIVVGTGVMGRTHPAVSHMIGMFVNMLALRLHPSAGKTAAHFFQEVKADVLAAFEHQDYPFDELVKKLNLQRQYGRNPLFDTEFTFHETGDAAIDIPGLKIETYEYEHSLLKFDLSLTAYEEEGCIHLILGFSPDLFKRETIEKMSGHFIEIMEQLPGQEQIPLKDISISHGLSTAGNVFQEDDYSGFGF